ncbi:MAG: 4-hydroxy-3-methylbut-2-enyl diphosphate reductase [Gaiellales bacterium]
MVRRVVLASPRGYCAGVDRAVTTVRRALERCRPPVYVRRQIVHNAHVVAELERQGAIFVESETDVPLGATVVLSAHGVSPTVRANAAARRLHVIDATCPLVTKVHLEARRFAADGYRIVLIGHGGHEEVEGTIGEAPDHIVLVENVETAEAVDPGDTRRLAYLTQTTLSVDDTAEIIGVLRRRFPRIVGPASDDICYATTNRQRAVKALARRVDLVLVVGSENSSNSRRLVETAQSAGVRARLIDDEHAILPDWLVGVESVGITSGASAPESLVERVCTWFRRRGATEISELETTVERVAFGLPQQVRSEAA